MCHDFLKNEIREKYIFLCVKYGELVRNKANVFKTKDFCNEIRRSFKIFVVDFFARRAPSLLVRVGRKLTAVIKV